MLSIRNIGSLACYRASFSFLSILLILILTGCDEASEASPQEFNLEGDVSEVLQGVSEAREEDGEIASTRIPSYYSGRTLDNDNYIGYPAFRAEFNGYGNLKRLSFEDKRGRLEYRCTYEYVDGKRTRRRCVDPDGTLRSATSYSPSGSGVEEITTYYDDSGDLESTVTVSCDEGQIECAQISEAASGQEQWRLDEQRDSDGNVIKGVSPDWTEDFEYDAESRLIEWVSDPHDGAITRTYFEYNDRGNIIRRESKVGDRVEEVVTYEYIYDDVGNWVEKIERVNDIVRYRHMREITYRDH